MKQEVIKNILQTKSVNTYHAYKGTIHKNALLRVC